MQFRKALSFLGTDVAKDTRAALGLGTAATVSAKGWRGMIHGLTLSNNVSDATNDIDIAAGEAWDNANDALLDLTSGLTKRLDASWAVGTNQGGLDTGSKANSTWYHVWLIRRSDTGVVDVLFSTSGSSPTMPSNYDQKRRIGTIRTNSSGVIRPFRQWGDQFEWSGDSIRDLDTTSPATSATNLTVTVPPIEGVVWIGWILVFASSAGVKSASISSGGTASWNVGSGLGRILCNTPGGSGDMAVVHGTAVVNGSGQIQYGAASNVNISVVIDTKGWIDHRGRY